jgi:hypothetical protein
MRIEGREAAMEHIRKLAQIRAECEGEPMTSEEQRREWQQDEKRRIGAMLDEARRYGVSAYRVAINLLDSGLSYGEILQAARKTPAGPPSDQVHRAITTDTSFMEREEPEAEEDWLRQAREEAERAWAATMTPQKKSETKFQNMRPSEIAFHRMCAGLARDAASTRPTYRGDELDGALRREGEQAARRLRPGR